MDAPRIGWPSADIADYTTAFPLAAGVFVAAAPVRLLSCSSRLLVAPPHRALSQLLVAPPRRSRPRACPRISWWHGSSWHGTAPRSSWRLLAAPRSSRVLAAPCGASQPPASRGFSRLLGSSQLLAAARGSSHLLAAPRGFSRPLAAPRGSSRLLAAPRGSSRLLAAPRHSSRPRAPPRRASSPGLLAALLNFFDRRCPRNDFLAVYSGFRAINYLHISGIQVLVQAVRVPGESVKSRMPTRWQRCLVGWAVMEEDLAEIQLGLGWSSLWLDDSWP